MMAGIYISGMEMPKSCSTEACFVRTVSYEDGTVWCPVAKGYLGDEATVCPLVPVPPHGRLIDADALKASLVFAESTAEWAVPALRAVLMVIDETPSIIPESKEG